MTLGISPAQGDLLRSTVPFCEETLTDSSIYAVLHRECFRLFPDSMFADLFTDIGRRSVPPMIVAVVMVLQRIEGLSDREAVARFAYDVRFKYACGGLAFDHPGFVHTVLVDMRERLRRSEDPDRIFNTVLDVAKAAGLLGRKRVLDSTPLYDAVATMDTVTLIRSAIRGLLKVARHVNIDLGDGGDVDLAAVLGAHIMRDDDYTAAGKPDCDYDDKAAREALIDALARDAYALLGVLDGLVLDPEVHQAGELLATVVGQDLTEDQDGVFRIVRGVAKDRTISTVDTEARHGHKTSSRGFDGYKGHIAVDPDSEIITKTTATPGNTGDAAAAMTLLTDDLTEDLTDERVNERVEEPVKVGEGLPEDSNDGVDGVEPLKVYGDAAYGAGDLLEALEDNDVEVGCKVQDASAPAGMYTKDDFDIDLGTGEDGDHGTVTCPAGQSVPIRPSAKGGGTASFGSLCGGCPLAAQCTTAVAGRTIRIGRHEERIARARKAQKDPAWQADYKANRPKVERKIGHLMHRKHGGRRARVRGLEKVAADFALLAASLNLARLAKLGLTHHDGQWAVTAS